MNLLRRNEYTHLRCLFKKRNKSRHDFHGIDFDRKHHNVFLLMYWWANIYYYKWANEIFSCRKIFRKKNQILGIFFFFFFFSYFSLAYQNRLSHYYSQPLLVWLIRMYLLWSFQYSHGNQNTLHSHECLQWTLTNAKYSWYGQIRTIRPLIQCQREPSWASSCHSNELD